MFLTSPYPFGRDWARAAESVADVVTIDFVHELTSPRFGAHVAVDGRDFQVERFSPRPSRLLLPVSARVTASRVQTCLDRIVEEHGPIDLLHTHYYHGTRFVRHLRRSRRYVHTEHSVALTAVEVGGDAHHRPSPTGMRMARRGLGDAEQVIAVSAYLAECLSNLGLPVATVIPNPVDTELFRVSAERDPARVVWVGRLAPDKQPALAVQAFAEVLAERPDAVLEMIGAGRELEPTRALAEALGIGSSVSFAGHLPREEVAERVRTAAVYLNTSQSETFAVAVAEALAAGVPVVAPRATALPELVGPDDGVLFAPRDAGDAAIAIVTALDGGFDGEAIAARAHARCSRAAVAHELDAVYRAAVSGAVPSGVAT